MTNKVGYLGQKIAEIYGNIYKYRSTEDLVIEQTVDKSMVSWNITAVLPVYTSLLNGLHESHSRQSQSLWFIIIIYDFLNYKSVLFEPLI